MWAQAEWRETGDTADGRRLHLRVDRAKARLPTPEAPEGLPEKVTCRAITLSSDRLGVIARIDVAEAEDGAITPADSKRGKRPHISHGAYEPERVQVSSRQCSWKNTATRCEKERSGMSRAASAFVSSSVRNCAAQHWRR